MSFEGPGVPRIVHSPLNMGFPVLGLPSVIFDNLYKFLDVPDKIVFSKCSRSMKAIVKSKEGLNKGYYLDVPIDAEQTCIQLNRDDDMSDNYPFSWTLHVNKILMWDADKVIIDDGARIGAVELTMREEKDEWRSTVKKEDYEKKLLAIITLLKDLFHCTINEVSLDSDAGASFRKLFIESDVLHEAHQMDFYHETCTQEEMIFMLDHFTVHWFNLRTDCGPGFSYPKPLKQYPRLYLQYPRWINLSHLQELAGTGTSIELENTDMITDKDINQFVKWWIGSDTEDLKVVYLSRSTRKFDQAAIMEGIPSTPGRKKHDNEIPYCNSVLGVWYDTGLDICRKDGVQATVIMKWSWFALGVLQKQDRENN